MSIIFLERSKKIAIGPGKEASSPHIVVKAGGLFCQISCTGCRSNRKKPFKNNLFKPNTRTEVFFPAVCTLIYMLN